MALADVLRERASRRGSTAQVDCGELGTVTVEALSPRECAALGMADGGSLRSIIEWKYGGSASGRTGAGSSRNPW